MNVLAIIPARFESSRFPGKPLIDIRGKSMIRRVYERVCLCPEIQKVVVATDDSRIVDECIQYSMEYKMTSPLHTNGTERCAEVVELMEETYDLILNVQGDEPFVSPQSLVDLIAIFHQSKEATIGTLVEKMTQPNELFEPSIIKVVFDKYRKALYFSRQAIPFQRGVEKAQWFENYTFWKHIGLYAYKPKALKRIVAMSPSALEISESLEQLRWVENGFEIYVRPTISHSKSIDTPEDLQYILNHFEFFSNE